MSVAEDNLRGDLESAFAAQRAAAEPEPVETEVTPVAVVATDPVAVDTDAAAQERARDEKGRFAAKGERPDAAAAEPAAAAKPVADRAGDRPEQDPAKPAAVPAEPKPEAALAPPNGWSTEAKAKWHELPPEIMAAVQKREQDVAKFTSTRDEHASFGRDIHRAVQPYLAQIQAEGGTPVSAVQSLLNTAYVLRTGTPEAKRDLLLKTAREYGVDLGQPAAEPAATGLETIQQRLDRLEHERQYERDAAGQRLQNEVDTEIAAFAADPKHPHYQTVKGHMAALIGQGAAKDLQDAYDQAVWASPDTRATVLAQQRAEDEQKRRADAKTRADAAKRKSIGITGGPGNTAAKSAPEDRSLREELEANVAALSGAV